MTTINSYIYRFPFTDGIHLERRASLGNNDPHTLFRIDRNDDQFYLWTPTWRVDIFRRQQRQ